MRILWYGDTPWLPTGYGRIAQLVLPKLAEKGIEIIIQAKAGHQGRPIDLGYALLYGIVDRYSITNIPAIAKAHEVDMVVFMADLWAFDLKQMKAELGFIPIVSYYPLDTEEVPIASRFQMENYVDYVIPMSEHARDKVAEFLPKEKLLDTIYPPIPTDTYDVDETVSKFDIGFKDYDFVFGMVQMNKDIVRKDQARQIYALKKALERLKDNGIDKKVGIYCHMLPGGEGTGFNLQEFAQHHGLEDDVHYPIPEAYQMGFKDKQMAQIYNGIDALLQCTSGEGFGMPTAEAMLCGTPVIGSLNSSTKELIELSKENAGVECNETILLAPSPFKIASFDDMVNTIYNMIVNGVDYIDKTTHRHTIEPLVNSDVVMYQWLSSLQTALERNEKACKTPPALGFELIENTKSMQVVTGRRTHG